MNELSRVAASSIGANSCIAVEKFPDGMYNKTFLLSMDDGQEVIAKVPNPNSGAPYFTTASEVATMDFVSCLTCFLVLLLIDPSGYRSATH
jgi:hypothetical protein